MKKYILLLCGVFLFGCTSIEVRSKDTYILGDLCNEYNISWDWDSLSQIVTLRDKDFSARVLIDSTRVLVGEKNIILSESVKVIDGEIIVPADFKDKVISILKEDRKVFKSNIPLKVMDIVIDAGHGGKDPGATSPSGLKEKKVVLDIARKIKKILKKRGVNVVMTRNKDKFISLQERTRITSRQSVDLFVSIHANSNPSKSIQGMEVYTVKSLSAKDRKEAQRKENHALLFKTLKMKQTDGVVKKIIEEKLYEHKHVASEILSKTVSDGTCRHVRNKNRGMKHGRFFVLRNTLVPSILVEVGYLTNIREERLLKTGSYRQKLAEGIAESILEYGREN